MHEWALAESLINTAIEAAKKEKLKMITEIRIQIGELQQIEKDIFEFALKEIIKSKGEKLRNTKTTIKIEESKLKCNNCENIWKFSDVKNKLNNEESEAIHFIPETTFVHTRCLKCGSPDFKITSGRGVTIASIKGER